MTEAFVNNIFSVTDKTFDEQAIAIFQYQYKYNKVYQKWVDSIGVQPETVESIQQIPFIPVSLFKTREIVTGEFRPDIIFESSGTTQTINSKHFVKDQELYKRSFTKGFELFYGNVSDWCIIGLLPAYLERSGSSLVAMVDELIKLTGHAESGFYLYDFEKLRNILQQLEDRQQKTLVIGVTFALLDFAEQYKTSFKYVTVMETGGMKGRRREMIREEVHSILCKNLGLQKILSEYGMTELLSQAYSYGAGLFKTVPWMKILIRDEDDPLTSRQRGRGLINVIDLANLHSCAFIATEDVGTLYEDGSFEVLGRFDHTDIRGCSLLAV